jgi:hypothetical protein
MDVMRSTQVSASDDVACSRVTLREIILHWFHQGRKEDGKIRELGGQILFALDSPFAFSFFLPPLTFFSSKRAEEYLALSTSSDFEPNR